MGNLLKRNEALLGKWLWRFPKEKESLWHEIIVSKYGLHTNGWDANIDIKCSYHSPWKSIAKVWSSFVQNIRLVVGKGDTIRFWEDIWVGVCPLKESFPRIFHLSNNRKMSIHSVVSWSSANVFSWNLTFFRNFNDREFSEYLSLLQVIQNANLNQNLSDKRVWTAHQSGEFSCKSFFDILSSSQNTTPLPQFNFIWKRGVPSKIKVFAWLALLGRVNTCDLLQKWRPYMCFSPSWCVLCKDHGEDIDHILLHCKFVRLLWNRLFGFMGVLPRRWAEAVNIKWSFKQSGSKFKCIWRLLLMAVAWSTWLERNKRVFDDRYSSPEEVWNYCVFIVGLWAKALNVFNSVDCHLFVLNCDSFMS